jgi:hypothetical protein
MFEMVLFDYRRGGHSISLPIKRVLKQLEKAWIEFKESYAGLSDSKLTEPDVTGNWSVKDIIAHVIWWEEEAVNHPPLIIEGGSPPQYSTYE